MDKTDGEIRVDGAVGEDTAGKAMIGDGVDEADAFEPLSSSIIMSESSSVYGCKIKSFKSLCGLLPALQQKSLQDYELSRVAVHCILRKRIKIDY